MKLTSCRVQNYRSIRDSGWVDIDDIAVVVAVVDMIDMYIPQVGVVQWTPRCQHPQWDCEVSARQDRQDQVIIVKVKLGLVELIVGLVGGLGWG